MVNFFLTCYSRPQLQRPLLELFTRATEFSLLSCLAQTIQKGHDNCNQIGPIQHSRIRLQLFLLFSVDDHGPYGLIADARHG